MKKFLTMLSSLLVLAMLLSACQEKASAPSGQTEDASAQADDQWTNPQLNEHTLTKLRLTGRGDAAENYKLAFFEPESLEGVEAFLICYSVSDFEQVWDCLAGLTCEELYALDQPANRAYVMTDLSYCDGVGNTLNTAQKDVVSGEDFSQPGIHYFYAAAIGKDGLLSLEKAEQTAFLSPVADNLTFTHSGDMVSGSFESHMDSDIRQNYVFLSADGYERVQEQLKSSSRAALDALAENGSALRFDNAEHTEFSLSLSRGKDLSGQPIDVEHCYYVYVASASEEKLLGLSYCASQLVTPAAAPLSTEVIGDGRGVIFPNGGAAQIGGGRGSIVSTSQAIFKDLPKQPRIAVIGAASGSEREIWSHFYLDDSSVKSFENRFAEAGFEAVYIPLTVENRESIGDDDYFASLVSSCHGVYFTGGDQSLGMYALTRSDGSFNAIGKAICDLFSRGGFVAGTSAGAHMLGDICFQDADSYEALTHPRPKTAELSSNGVSCGPEGVVYDGLPCVVDASGHSVIFDSHFGARGRLGRLSVMQGAAEADFAIGLDEDTGFAVSGGIGVVYGAGTVTVLDGRQAAYGGTDSHFAVNNLGLFLLSAGDKFDFASGTVIPAASKTPASGDCTPEYPEELLGGNAQAKAMLSFALSPEESMAYKTSVSDEEFTFVFEKTPDFAAFIGEKNYALSALSGLPMTAVSGITLDIH